VSTILAASRVADYQFVRHLGALGRGQYYLARRPSRLPIDDELVVVKVLSGSTTNETFEAATRELRAFASVSSPHLVRLFDAGQEGSTFYYAMQYLPLGSLAAPARPLARNEVLMAVADAARATHALHEAGIAHCDIKPANIMVDESGGCLADLGLAQVVNPGQTLSGMADVASIEFIDPNLMMGGQPGRATDIWSLGATLHRVLTGAGVYGELESGDPLLALRKVLSSAPVFADGLDDDPRRLITTCLDPDPTNRPQTADEVARTIDGWT